MGIDKIIKLAMILVLTAMVTGHLQQITMMVRRAQVQLRQDSRASHWGSPDLLYKHRR